MIHLESTEETTTECGESIAHLRASEGPSSVTDVIEQVTCPACLAKLGPEDR